MVVLSILAIAFTYGFVNMDALVPSARLEEGARAIGGLLTRIRGMAVFHGRSFFVEYDLDRQRYRVYRPADPDEIDDGAPDYIEGEWRELPTHVRFLNVQFSDRQKESQGTHEVEFSPTGEVVGHLVHLISDDIADPERSRFTIELNPVTGLVSYTRGEKEYQLIRDEYAFR